MTTPNTNKPTYEELEYQHAVLYAGYKKLKEEKGEVEEKILDLYNFLNKLGLDIQERINK